MTTTTPESVGLSSQRLSRIRPAMQALINEQRCAGIMTVIARRGQIAHGECVGLMEIEAQKPMQTDAIFRIYSMSKPITSAAIMMLYEEGKFQLNDPVSKFIPEFKATKVVVRQTDAGLKLTDQDREMTVQHLLTHTSGLSYGFDDNSRVDQMYRDMFKKLKLINHQTHQVTPDGKPLAKIMPELAQIPLAHQPGTAWRYSFAIDVLGYLVEVLSGVPFDVFLHQRIFDPLQMVDTGFSVPVEKGERLAAMYKPGEKGGLELLDAPADSPLLKPHRFFSGGGGLVSTASDYLRFARMLLNKGDLDGVRLLGRKTVEFMTQNHLPDDVLRTSFNPERPGYGFGLGGSVLISPPLASRIGSVGTFSWGGAARTDFWVDPQEELIGLFMVQLLGDAPWLADQFRVLAYQAIVD
jgi:CubicO group peptidase (beta-lactamase class C family)